MSEATQAELLRLADKIETDEDFAMHVGEDARAALESEGMPDRTIAAILNEADADVIGFAMPADNVAMTVKRIAEAARSVAAR
ncbi:hypothetical protein [Euzebya tangerina]|uniref:hypothetical protein n=1 Tax=Euzebya tangerina TaxID=591198 RepID=UPI000E31021D|nr:hypothetical protein [Euzebya tangerina]